MKYTLLILQLFLFTIIKSSENLTNAIEKGDLVEIENILQEEECNTSCPFFVLINIIERSNFTPKFAEQIGILFLKYVNEKYYNKTPLNYAIERISVASVKLLIKLGADINLQDDLKSTPLIKSIIYH